MKVSTTVPAKGTTEDGVSCPQFRCFNYRAREGHDRTDNGSKAARQVSTTVPAKGTTE